MQIRLRDLAAKCTRCGCEEFEPLVEGDNSPQAVFICEKCRTPATRVMLLMDIAEKTLEQANEFLEESRRRRRERDGNNNK
jgi:hypothetical protein